ncbi:S-adenosyl-L-methionine-dependent methyltransferase [Ascodesmis nigricans]|uniref:Arsenite methyltransferase n=1 Tax=Ascodesmis nigricans TaxID=341454 RepID=A0A4S2MQ63_9PEZI|nr:S-adenosyl-L-methionine-dependent methyltransferase [Ascodesmis nigricans]
MSSCKSNSTYDLVSSHYGKYASTATESASAYNASVAESFGYSAEELASIPTGSNLGVSCGNPLATANLQPHETLIDLGCGGGLDVFLAARKLPQGRAIGVDMTPSMLSLARKNAASASPPITNVDFVEANITDISPLADGIADVIVSNCVINLVPDEEKPKVFREVFRLLKNGGRMAVSDMLTRREIPEDVRGDVGLYIGCVSGASRIEEYERWMKEAGFKDIAIIDTKSDVNVYKEGIISFDGDEKVSAGGQQTGGGCCGGTTIDPDQAEPAAKERAKRVANLDLNEFVGSFKIFAVKPQA